ncbi:hypothetical protein C8R46DRAFT_1214079 [Mycena filopes]|nr:hypothetical protein C8R46DRAFT_1214079 [Mycena filopes]
MDELERGFDTLLNLRLPHAETFPSSSDERRQIPPTPTILPLPSNDIRVRILESSDSHVASLQDKIRSIGEEISAYRDDPEGELLSLQAELEGLQEASIEAQLHQDLREEDWIRAEEQNEVIRNDLRTVENANTELVRRLDALSKEIDQVTRKKQYMEQSLATSSITIDPMNSNNREAVEDAVKRECTNLVTGFQARLAKELNTEETRLKDKRNRRAVLVAQLSRLQEERLELSNNLKLEKHVEGKLDYHDQNIHQRMQGLLDEARTQKAIRSLMQTLLGIRNDRGIGEAILKNGHCATLAEATEFAIADDPTQPTLTPFRPCWDDIKGSWNLALEDLFLAQFKTDYPEYSSDESYIRNHFRQRLETLRAAFFVQLRESNQPDLRDEAGSNRRRRERRRTLFRRRKGWTKDNAQSIKQSNGEETISLLCEMVELLGTDGMSSDESGSDSTKRCNVLHKNWRNPDVVRLLKWIDLHKPNHNVYGDRTGNPPHRRLRLPHGKAPESLRRAIANLPINFYNPIWYEGLSAGQKIRLGATVAQPLPLYILTWPRTGLASDPDDLDDY